MIVRLDDEQARQVLPLGEFGSTPHHDEAVSRIVRLAQARALRSQLEARVRARMPALLRTLASEGPLDKLPEERLHRLAAALLDDDAP